MSDSIPPQALLKALVDVREHSTNECWGNLFSDSRDRAGAVDEESAIAWTAVISNQDHRWRISRELRGAAGISWQQLTGAMAAIDYFESTRSNSVELIWTGPANGRFPVNRIDQTLYDLVASAKNRILLVTFAAHKVTHLCTHLAKAIKRGVSLSLIVEGENESEGQLTADAVKAFAGLPKERFRVFYWPTELRERNSAGRPGKLHAKCAVVDGIALVGSANLTDDAFNRNMELGVLIHDSAVVESLFGHFQELVHKRVLVEIPRK